MDSSEKKLHIDENWKDQVEREKEAAKAKAGATQTAAQRAPNESPSSSSEESVRRHAAQTTGEEQPFGEPAGDHVASDTRDYALPPPSLAFLITTLGTQAMVALGEIPNPITGKLERLPNQAKHFIDTLGMLEEKTAGNRTPEESALLSSLLHQMRMAFVAAQTTSR
jgi:hypothetical protein